MTDSTITNKNLLLTGSGVEFDFDSIKSNLKEFLRGQEEFKDYNFEASGLAVLIDLLAYNSHMNAMSQHLAMSELFLPSANARSNIVSLASHLGYVPNSRTSAMASIDIDVFGSDFPLSDDGSNGGVFIQQGTVFSGGGLSWYATEDSFPASTSASHYLFSGVSLAQGIKKTMSYYYDTQQEYQKFEIPDPNIVTDSIRVKVFMGSTMDGDFNEYRRFTDFAAFSRNSLTKPYFIQENSSGLYEIYFSSIPEEKPAFGARIQVEYISSAGTAGNGIKFFTTDVSIINGSENRRYTTITQSNGGKERESKESIRVNSLNLFPTQNRCVTVEDYTSLIMKEFPQTESVNVWGGENHLPPTYGSVFVCIKPLSGLFLSDSQKEHIKKTILDPKNVVSLIPEIIDPDYTYVSLTVDVQYDTSRTLFSKTELRTRILSTIKSYTSTVLEKFDKTFRQSSLFRLIDQIDSSILGIDLKIKIIKRVRLSRLFSVDETMSFPKSVRPIKDWKLNRYLYTNSPIRTLIDGRERICTLIDVDSSDKDSANKRRITLVDQNDKIVNSDVGYIDLDQSIIRLYGFTVTTDVILNLFLIPERSDFVPERNQLFTIDDETTSITLRPYQRSEIDYGN